jgi:two-component system sensor histidine kinase DegS
MTASQELPSGSAPELAARLSADVATLERELTEIDMLIGQARVEATRHEQKRASATNKVIAQPGDAQADALNQLVALTRRAVLMESQVDLLESKRKALARHRDALAEIVTALEAGPPGVAVVAPAAAGEDMPADDAPPPPVSRVVLNAQEDLRREIARAMHDGPAQSLTNIVLQAQIVARLVNDDVDQAQHELEQLIAMVQQTLDATKSFIFDVRPMVLDDLGLLPTLRRSARDRGRREGIPVTFESLGQDRRLPMELESTVFRIVDEALTAYLHLEPERMSLILDWTDELEVRLVAERAAIPPEQAEPLPEVPTDDVPDAIRQMIQDRHDVRRAAAEAAEAAAVVVLPAATQRDVVARAGYIAAKVEILAGGSELRLVVPLAAAATNEDPGSRLAAPVSAAEPAGEVPGEG